MIHQFAIAKPDVIDQAGADDTPTTAIGYRLERTQVLATAVAEGHAVDHSSAVSVLNKPDSAAQPDRQGCGQDIVDAYQPTLVEVESVAVAVDLGSIAAQ